LVIGGDGLAGVFRWRGYFRPRPLGEDREGAGGVISDLPGVLIGEVAPGARSPELAGPADQIVVGSVRWFHRRPHGRLLAVPCSWSPVSESHRWRWTYVIFILSVPIAGIANLRRVSAALRPRG